LPFGGSRLKGGRPGEKTEGKGSGGGGNFSLTQKKKGQSVKGARRAGRDQEEKRKREYSYTGRVLCHELGVTGETVVVLKGGRREESMLRSHLLTHAKEGARHKLAQKKEENDIMEGIVLPQEKASISEERLPFEKEVFICSSPHASI